MKRIFCQYCGGVTHQLEIDGRLRDVCSQCRKVAYKNPVPSTGVVVLDEQNRFLMVKRTVEPKIGHWCLPGGFMEIDESPVECALRELREETALVGKNPVLLDALSTKSQFYPNIAIMGYLVREWEGTPMPGDDAGEVGWFGFDNHPEIAFEPHRAFVNKVRGML